MSRFEDFAKGLDIWSPEFKERTRLLDLVFLGRMSPADAEQSIAQQGLSPLVGRPDPSRYNPMHESGWTPIQAIVWIAFRDVDRVRDVSEMFRDEWYRWVHVEAYDGYNNELVGPATLTVASLRWTNNAPWDMGNRLFRARGELHDALSAGKVQARGRPHDDAKREEIPRSAWIDMGIQDSGRARSHDWTGYDDIVISRSDILQIWESKIANSERTGAPGRPTSMHLLREEAERRRQQKLSETSVSAEANHLRSWFERTHPKLTIPTAKTIENNIRSDHRLRTNPPKL